MHWSTRETSAAFDRTRAMALQEVEGKSRVQNQNHVARTPYLRTRSFARCASTSAALVAALIALLLIFATEDLGHAESASLQITAIPNQLESDPHRTWISHVGSGFQPGTETFQISLGGNYGLDKFGSIERHHLAIASLAYGRIIGPVRGAGHWYGGNLELRLELFGGSQFSPSAEWFVGLTPHLRYHFATGTRLVPFLDVGFGVTATGIDVPDLSNIFEFNSQGGGGLQYFFREDLALVAEVKYVHWSCAGLSDPNRGLNGITGLLGITLFF